MNFRKKIKKNRRERQLNYTKLALFSLILILFSATVFAQDSIPEKEDLTEAAEMKFQQFFFKALSEKSIGNYKKAIENLESCNQVLSNDFAVYFEFSKNYLLLNNTLEAKEYIKRALEKDADNIWMLKHSVEIYIKDKNYKKAIEIQQKVISINPKEKEYLARLYVYDRQYEKAISYMSELEKDNALSAYLKRLKTNLEKRSKVKPKKEKATDLSSLIDKFKTDKSYVLLEDILKKSESNTSDLLKFCKEGIALFPAQPFVYLINGKALNDKKNHKKALKTLQNGIDFVIEDKMEADFYIEIAKAYKGLGNSAEEKKYKQKAKNLKS
jgi:tetratricopeptide (TPR) repeat protein